MKFTSKFRQLFNVSIISSNLTNVFNSQHINYFLSMAATQKKLDKRNSQNLNKIQQAIEKIGKIREAMTAVDKEIDQETILDRELKDLDVELSQKRDEFVRENNLDCSLLESSNESLQKEIEKNQSFLNEIDSLKNQISNRMKEYESDMRTVQKGHSDINDLTTENRKIENRKNMKIKENMDKAKETKVIADHVMGLKSKLKTCWDTIGRIRNKKENITVDDNDLLELVRISQFGNFEDLKNSIQKLITDEIVLKQDREKMEQVITDNQRKQSCLKNEKDEIARKREVLGKEHDDSLQQVRHCEADFNIKSKTVEKENREIAEKIEKLKFETKNLNAPITQQKYNKDISVLEEKIANEKLKSFELGTDIDAMMRKAEESEFAVSEEEDDAQDTRKSPESKFKSLSIQAPVDVSSKIAEQKNLIGEENAFDDEDDTDMGFSNASFLLHNDTMKSDDMQ